MHRPCFVKAQRPTERAEKFRGARCSARAYPLHSWRMANGEASREVLPSCIGERYRVEQLLGTGGMASVYQVHDLASGRKLALKRLNARDSASAARDDALLSQAEVTQDAPLGAAAAVHAGQLFEREFDTLSQLV